MERKPYLDCLPLLHQGKVRDTFATNVPGTRLIVATDAVSTHNVPHKSLVPAKGQILNALSIFWALEVMSDIPTHIVAYGKRIYDYLPMDRCYPDYLFFRAIIARNLVMSPHEYIYRARMAGSLWSKFYKKGLPNPYGLFLPEGLQLMSPFSDLLFTPTEKSETDDEEDAGTVALQCPEETNLTRKVYQCGRDFALSRGIDIIDFKAEAGRDKNGRLRLGDEWLNGDCCRFVEADKIVVGQEPPWADKEILRQEAAKQWGDGPKVPLTFSPEAIERTVAAYRNVFRILTGRSVDDFQRHVLC